MVNRREFLFGAGAALTFSPGLLRAVQESRAKLIQRAVPSTGELLPCVGLGQGWSRSVDPAAAKEVLKTLFDGGGRVIDTVHGGPPARQLAGSVAAELGVAEKLFWSTGLLVPAAGPATAEQPAKADPAAVKEAVEKLLAMFQVPRIDLVQVLAHADVPTHLRVLDERKQDRRVRYVGVTDLAPPLTEKASAPAFARLESLMRNEPIDFVGMDYSVLDRRAEETILPLAQERKIGVIAYFPFDRSRLLKRAGAVPLPDWAAEFDATTWAQFCLKYVLGHPAVTVVRTGTSNAKHMLDNLGGGIGRLPDEATRKRMAQFVDALPAPASPRK
jgi:aryl-alcohol dehydrogenase-like predicted oxidoreductase